MPANKNAQYRYSIIDSCLQRTKRKWFLKDLQQHINDKFRDRYGDGHTISRRTLLADIAALKPDGETGYDAPIEFDKQNGYYYSQPGYSIYDAPISLDDLPVLQQVLANLRQLLGIGLTDELSELVKRLEYRLSHAPIVEAPAIIQFEVVPTYAGLPWLAPLYQAIRQRQVIQLQYQPFNADFPRPEVVHPHLLKQYNHRWFLLGLNHSQNRLSTYALDRVQQLVEVKDEVYQPITIDPDTYFDQIIGSSVPRDKEVEDIHLWFSAFRGPYIRTKPLHPTQKIIVDAPEGLEIKLQLIPTRELMTLLLGFGADMRVMSPVSLQLEMQSCLIKSLEFYNSMINSSS